MKKILMILTMALAATSCMDILDVAPEDQIASENMWTTEELADKGMAGLYYPVLCHPTLVYPAPACRRFEPPGNRSHELRNRLLFQQLSGGTAFAGYQTCQ